MSLFITFFKPLVKELKLTAILIIGALIVYNMVPAFAKLAFAQQKTFSFNSNISETDTASNDNTDDKKPKKPQPPQVLILGDSLTSGHGIKENENNRNYYTYAVVLEKILRKFGYPVKVVNSSVAGSTTGHAYARLVKLLNSNQKFALVIVAVGYNDSLAKIPVRTTTIYMEKILEKLDDNNIPTVLFGIKAPANSPKDYAEKFNSIYPKMSSQFNIPFYPYLLDGIFMLPRYTLADLVHPNVRGLNLMVQKTAPIVMYALFESLNGRRPVKHPKKKKKTAQ